MEKQSWRIEEDGKWTYYRDGNKVKGLQKIGDRIFFFNMKGYLIKETWLNIDGNMFYVLSNGSELMDTIITSMKKPKKIFQNALWQETL